MKKLQTILTVIVFCFCATSCSEDVVSTFGSVYGIVTDAETGEPLRNVSVTLAPGNETTVTGNDGHYEFADLEAGLYKLQFYLHGYATTSRQVTVVAGKRCVADAVLSHSNSPGGDNGNTGGNDNTGGNNGDNGAASVGLNVKELDFGDSETELSFKIYNLEDATADLEWKINPELHKCLTVSPMSGTLPVGYYNTVKVTLNRSTMTSDIDTTIDIYDLNDDVYYYPIPVKAKYQTSEPQEDYSSAAITFGDDRLKAEIVSCRRTASTLVFEFRLTNIGLGDAITDFRIDSSYGANDKTIFYDSNGNFYKYPKLEFAGKSTTTNEIGCNLPQDVPMKGTLTISNFDTSATHFNARFYIYIYNNSVQLRDNNLYFKNVPIY